MDWSMYNYSLYTATRELTKYSHFCDLKEVNASYWQSSLSLHKDFQILYFKMMILKYKICDIKNVIKPLNTVIIR